MKTKPRRARRAAVLVVGLGAGFGALASADVPPAPPGVHLSVGETIRRDPGGRCTLVRSTSCPEGARCNPPPPRQVACPDALSAPGRLRRRDDGRCVVDLDVHCPPPSEATCNPPPPRVVPCP